MEFIFIIGLVLGVVVGVGGMVYAMRRAESKPEGKTATFMSMLHRQE